MKQQKDSSFRDDEKSFQSTKKFRLNAKVETQEHIIHSEESVRRSRVSRPSFEQEMSIKYPSNKSSKINKDSIELKPSSLSSNAIKHKLPLAILDFIVKTAKDKAQEQNKKEPKSKVIKAIGKMNLSKKMEQKKTCEICESELPKSQFQKISKKCEHEFCSSCLHQYVLYKINAFESVECPNDDCFEPMDQEAQLYKELPLEARKKYKKLLQYNMMKEHPNRKLCPKEKCEGWVQISDDFDPCCSVCRKVFCPKCMLEKHDGDCDDEQLNFFQNTLHYRQCKRCKNVVQKSSGCIHMTCRCGYQFCYLCGAKWKHSHTCKNEEEEPVFRQPIQCLCCECTWLRQIETCECCEEDNCCGCCEDCLEAVCQCECCDACCDCLETCCDTCCDGCGDCCDYFCGCECCEEGNCCGCCGVCCDSCCDCCGDCCDSFCDCCGDCCENLVLNFIKTVILFFAVTLIYPMFAVLSVIMLLIWAIASFFAGITVYAIQTAMEQEETHMIIGSIVCFPITMGVGVYKAFGEIFSEIYCDFMQDLWANSRDIIEENLCCSDN